MQTSTIYRGCERELHIIITIFFPVSVGDITATVLRTNAGDTHTHTHTHAHTYMNKYEFNYNWTEFTSNICLVRYSCNVISNVSDINLKVVFLNEFKTIIEAQH